MNEILVYFAIKYGGDWDKIYSAINKKEKVEQEDIKRTLVGCGEYITLLDKEYPYRLKTIYKPPFVLFYKGDINLLNYKNTIGVIGSRKNTSYGEKVTKKIVKELVDNNYLIVSGLARGIDSIAHKQCLDNGGKTIAVLGNGLNYDYPLENKFLKENIINNGLVISEYPFFVEPNKDNFPKRNRIVAGLSDSILVTEAKNKSGAMITVNRALEMGKDIYCIPHHIDSNSGCNSLIKEGAKLVENANDIISEI